MAGKKKQGRITVALVCTESGATNYHISVHKDNKPEKLRKYCAKLMRHTRHKLKEKLK